MSDALHSSCAEKTDCPWLRRVENIRPAWMPGLTIKVTEDESHEVPT
jgi:hypothetical protein